MTNQLTSLEIQLIRSSLATKTNEEIAEILELPVEKVIAVIDELTNGEAEARLIDVQNYKNEQELKKKKVGRPRSKMVEKGNDDDDIKRIKRPAKIYEMEQERKKQKDAWEARQKLQTRVIDWGNMKSVRVDSKTVIFINKDDDPKEAIALYEANRMIVERKKDIDKKKIS